MKGFVAVARAHKRGLRALFIGVTVLALVVFAVEYFFPVNDQESFGWMIFFASLPWSIVALVLPLPAIGMVFIAAGIGVNAVIAAIMVLWWVGTLRGS